MGQTYTCAFSALPSTAVVKDMIHVLSSTLSRLKINEVTVALASTAARSSTAYNALAVTLVRGSTVADSGGSTGVIVAHDGRLNASGVKIDVGSSTPASGASGKVVHAGVVSPFQSYCYRPAKNDRLVIGLAERFSVRTAASTAALSISGSICFDEVGKTPGEND